MHSAASLLTAFLVTVILLASLRRLAGRIELVDHPNVRKPHMGRVPLIGGLAMFCGFMLGALTVDMALTPFRGFFAACAVLVVVGVLDDLHELSSRARFGAQIAAAVLMAYWGGVVLHDLGALRPDARLFVLGGWEVAFTIFATVGVINALNMADGIDGLAGGYSLIALLGLTYVAHAAGRVEERQILLLLCVVVVAFLVFNVRLPGRPQALVFMGDAGSMLLGFALTWFVIALSQGEARAMTPVTALWLLLLPLFDTVWLLIRRPLIGRWPTSAGFEHLHHVLQMTGMSVGHTVGLLWGVACVSAVAGVAALRVGVPENLMFYAFLTLFAIYCVVMGTAWRYKRLAGWPMDRRLAPDARRADAERRSAERRLGKDRRAQSDRRG